MATKKSTSTVKKRNWAFVLYPESAPADWLDQLQKTGLQGAISPLHDSDLNADQTAKKPHYHVIVCYSGPTSYNVVKSLTDALNQPIPQALEQIRGYYRYFTHKDNPEKHQYNESDIRSFNGFSISDYVELTRSEIQTIKNDLIQFVRDNHITEYGILVNIVTDCQTDGTFNSSHLEVLCNNTMFFTSLLKSYRHGGFGDSDRERERPQGGILAGGDLRSEAEQIQPLAPCESDTDNT